MAKARTVTGLKALAATGDNARIILRVRLAELMSWDQYADHPYNVRELHNMRISAKRLRYTIEIFGPLFPTDYRSVLHEIVQLQDELGDLHDADVMIALLRLCLAGEDSGTGYDEALAGLAQRSDQDAFLVNPALLAHLVAPDSLPTAEQRVGLEALEQHLHVQRDALYKAFRAHWYALKGRDFAHEVLALFNA